MSQIKSRSNVIGFNSECMSPMFKQELLARQATLGLSPGSASLFAGSFTSPKSNRKAQRHTAKNIISTPKTPAVSRNNGGKSAVLTISNERITSRTILQVATTINTTSNSSSQKTASMTLTTNSSSKVVSSDNSAVTSGMATPALPFLLTLHESAPSAFKIFLSYYQWDERKAAIKELADFLRAHNFEILNDQIDDYHDQSLQTVQRKKEVFIQKEADLIILFISESYKQSATCKAEAVQALRGLHNKLILIVATKMFDLTSRTSGWLEDILPQTIHIIDFSDSSIFAAAAVEILERIQLAMGVTNPQLPDMSTIRVKKRVGIPQKLDAGHFSREEEEDTVADAITELCESHQLSLLAVTGSPGIGKSTLVRHVITDAKYESHLAVTCKIQNIVWYSPGSALAKTRPFIDKICGAVLEALGGNEQVANHRKIGAIIDEAMLDNSRRFLLVVDDNDCSKDVLESVFKLQSKALRCLLITRNTEKLQSCDFILGKQRVTMVKEVEVQKLPSAEIYTILKQEILKLGTLNALASQCNGSPVLADFFRQQVILKRNVQHLEEMSSNFQKNGTSPSMEAILQRMLKFSLENEIEKVVSLYFKTLFFGPNRRFSTSDVATLFDCDEATATKLCSKWCAERLLIREEEDTASLPDWLYTASLENAKSKGFVKTSVKDFQRQLVSISLLHRAVEKRREELLLYILSETAPEVLATLCRDQSSYRNKMTFLQHLYNTDWKQVECSGQKRNVAAHIMVEYLRKLSASNISIAQIVSLPDLYSDCALGQILRNTHDQSRSHKTLRRLLWKQGASKLAEAVEERLYWVEEARTKDAKKALYVAAIRGQLQTANLLVKSNTPNASDIVSALLAASANGHADVVRLLHWNGAEIDEPDPVTGDTALIAASRNGHCHIAAFLCQNGANVTARNREGVTPLIAAARRGWSDVVHYLIKDANANINERNHEGWCALMAAAKIGHLSVVRLLVSEGADFEAENNDHRTALIVAAENGQLDIVAYLLSIGADIDAKDRNGISPLTAAASNGYAEVVDFLICQGGDLAGVTNVGLTALHCAVMNNHIDVAKVLLSKGADATLKDNNGLNALMYAAKNGSLELVEIFLHKVGYDPQDNKDGATLILATANNYTEIVECLLDRGADVNAPRNVNAGISALLIASQNGNVQLVKLLLSRGANTNARTKDGSTALILSSGSKNPSLEILQMLLQNGADVNVKTNNGWTALMAASFSGNVDVVKWLIINGAQINAKTESAGVTALISAARAGHFDVVRCLVANGANINCKTIQGANALMFAQACDHQEIVNYLLSKV